MAGLQTNTSRTIFMALAILASLGAIGYQMWQSKLFSGQTTNSATSSAQAPTVTLTAPLALHPDANAPQREAGQNKTETEVKTAAVNAQSKSDSQTKPDVKSAQESKPGTEAQKQTNTPEFDVVRVEESGDAVVAGRAAPNANVVLLNKGKEIARTKSDANGQFVFMPPALPPGEHLLALGVDQNGARQDSTQNVTISVPVKTAALSKEEAKPLVALSEPDKPTRILSETSKVNAPSQQAKLEPSAPLINAAPSNSPASNSPAQAPVTALRFRIVEADEKGAFFASGYGPPGGLVRLYLNDAPVASVTVGPDQQWSLKIEKGLIRGSYRVRADLISPKDGSVLARAEVPFDYTPVIANAPVEALPVAPAQQATNQQAASPQTERQTQSQAQQAQAKPVEAGPVEALAQSVVPAAPATAAPATSAPPASVAQVPAPTSPVVAAAVTPTSLDPANVVIKEIATVTVTRGDNLWRISRKLLGRGTRYTQIYEANTAQIRDPSLIYPNQVFVVPNKVD